MKNVVSFIHSHVIPHQYVVIFQRKIVVWTTFVVLLNLFKFILFFYFFCLLWSLTAHGHCHCVKMNISLIQMRKLVWNYIKFIYIFSNDDSGKASQIWMLISKIQHQSSIKKNVFVTYLYYNFIF